MLGLTILISTFFVRSWGTWEVRLAMVRVSWVVLRRARGLAFGWLVRSTSTMVWIRL